MEETQRLQRLATERALSMRGIRWERPSRRGGEGRGRETHERASALTHLCLLLLARPPWLSPRTDHGAHRSLPLFSSDRRSLSVFSFNVLPLGVLSDASPVPAVTLSTPTSPQSPVRSVWDAEINSEGEEGSGCRIHCRLLRMD